MFKLWAEKICSFPYLLLEGSHNPRIKGGLRYTDFVEKMI